MERVVVVGGSGSGKTTVARAISSALTLPHLELDSVRHGHGWDSVGGEEFSSVVSDFASREKLWGSVTEPWTNLYRRDPMQNIIVWTWTCHGATTDNSRRHAPAVAGPMPPSTG